MLSAGFDLLCIFVPLDLKGTSASNLALKKGTGALYNINRNQFSNKRWRF